MVLQNSQATVGQRDLHLHAVAREQWVDVLPAQWRQVGSLVFRAQVLIEGLSTDAKLAGQGGLPLSSLHPLA